jgi:hypothetical protein
MSVLSRIVGIRPSVLLGQFEKMEYLTQSRGAAEEEKSER